MYFWLYWLWQRRDGSRVSRGPELRGRDDANGIRRYRVLTDPVGITESWVWWYDLASKRWVLGAPPMTVAGIYVPMG